MSPSMKTFGNKHKRSRELSAMHAIPIVDQPELQAHRRKIRFVFILSPRTHFLDLAGPDQVLHEAIFYQAPFEVRYGSYTEDVSTSGGLHFCQLAHFSSFNLEKGDYIVVPGMDVAVLQQDYYHSLLPLMQWLSDQHAQGVNICSICTGAFVLARAGLLDGRSCTTHWKYTQVLQSRFPKVKVQENVLFTDKEGIFTSAGIASGIDLALHLVEKEMGSYFAYKVAREIVVYMRRDGQQQQQSVFLEYRNHLHSGIHAVQDQLAEHLDQKNTLSQLAAVAAMSTRNLTRIFKKETGITLGEYITLLRKARITELLKKPDLSRKQIAGNVGLESERQLGRLMRAQG